MSDELFEALCRAKWAMKNMMRDDPQATIEVMEDALIAACTEAGYDWHHGVPAEWKECAVSGWTCHGCGGSLPSAWATCPTCQPVNADAVKAAAEAIRKADGLDAPDHVVWQRMAEAAVAAAEPHLAARANEADRLSAEAKARAEKAEAEVARLRDDLAARDLLIKALDEDVARLRAALDDEARTRQALAASIAKAGGASSQHPADCVGCLPGSIFGAEGHDYIAPAGGAS